MSAPKPSRNHVYRTSSTKTLLIADSTTKKLEYTFSACCLCPARLQFPPKDIFDIIFLFVGGNDLHFFKKPTTTPASQVAHEIIYLANLLCHRAKVVYALGVLERNENKVRSKEVNDFLQSVGERKTEDHPLVT